MSTKLVNQEQQAERTYQEIRSSLVKAQRTVYTAVNAVMVTAYWEIGEQIYRACGENERAAYGQYILQYLSDHLTKEFGRGYTVRNLRLMRQFYLSFPIRNTLCTELSWSHYRHLMRVSDRSARDFYINEAAKSG